MKFSVDTIRFRVDIFFSDSDVDVVYTERRYGGFITLIAGDRTHEVQSKTPTSRSVDASLDKVYESPELAQKDVKVVESYGLTMGNCHFICEVNYDKFNPTLVSEVKAITKTIFGRTIRYYKPKTTLVG